METDRTSNVRLLTLAIIASSVAVYCNTLLGDFVYDDHALVVQNPWLGDLSYLKEIFTTGLWEMRGEIGSYYRPLVHLVYMTAYQIFGAQAWGFHLVNVLIHACVSVFVFRIASKLLEAHDRDSCLPVVPSFIAALLFCLHPIHTEAVAWISGIQDMLATLFCLVAFDFHLSGRAGLKSGPVLAAVSFFLASLSKEPALLLPPLIVAYDFFVGPPDAPAASPGPGGSRAASASNSLLGRYLPLLAAAGLYFSLRLLALGGMGGVGGHGAFTSPLNVLALLTEYAKALVIPIDLSVIHVLAPIGSLAEPRALLAIALTAALIAALAVSFKKSRIVFFSILLVLTPLLPALYVPALGRAGVIGERYLYFPSVGFALLTALLANRVAFFPKARLPVSAALVLLAALYAAGTIDRNTDWKDEFSLWTATVETAPESPAAHDGLGSALLELDDPAAAIDEFEHALRLDPELASARYHLATALGRSGDEERAVAELHRSLALKPDLAEAHHQLGLVYVKRGNNDKAIEHLAAAVNFDPWFVEAYRDLAFAYRSAGRPEQTIRFLNEAVRLDPDDADTHNNLGVAYAQTGSMDEAAEQFEIALRLAPGDASIRDNLLRARNRASD